jgi:hypothetical protein
MLITPMLTAGAMLDAWPTVAVVAAASELGVERVEGLHVEPA